MRLAGLLRLSAIGIALMCWLDPPLVVAPRPPVPVDVALVRSELDDMPAGPTGAATVVERMRGAGSDIDAALGAAADVRVHESAGTPYLPCDAQRPCVIVAGGRSNVLVPDDRRGPTFLVRVGEALAPNVTVTGLTVSATHTAAAGRAVVRLRGNGVDGRETRVRLFDGGAVVGETAHRWTGDGDAVVDVDWWPLAAGTRSLLVQAVLDGGSEETELDNQERADVEVVDGRWPVLVLERRPSWAGTFARRALEGDRRFALEARTDVAPGVSARPPGTGLTLDATQLDRARVVVVGTPDALGADDVTRLEAFVRRRGGALVLVPDRAFSGPVTRLLGHAWRERLTRTPVRAGSLLAREWLIAEGVAGFDEVVAASEEGPAVVSTPVGLGRIVVVGAMDAWRQRGSGEDFDRFWQGTIAGLAQTAGPAVLVTVEPRTAIPGQNVLVRLAARSVRALPVRMVSARLRCGDAPEVTVRLWPDHAPGAFVGRARAGAAGTCRAVGEMAGLGEGRADLVVAPDARGVGPVDETAIESLVTRTGGLVVTDRDLRPLTDALRALGSETRTPEARYPMRSAWWLLPLMACLSGEWWLRRRAGLR